MIFSYNWLQNYIKNKLPKPEKLAELLADHFFEIEEVKKRGSDFALDIDVKPNRAGDCFSHWGIAREAAAITNSKFKIQNSKFIEDKNLRARDFVTVEVKDKKACPRYTARVVTGVKVGSSPEWMRKRLELCGLQAISNIVDIANYVMLETGQPLHAFDLDKLESANPKSEIRNPKQQRKKLIVRFAKRGEKITTLDEQKFDLNKNVLVIADQKDPVAIAGIKGGKGPGIDNKTKTVVLESANFEPRTIRKGSKNLNLKTDASWRFEHGIDPNLTEIAINRAAHLIQEIASGKVARDLIDVYPEKVKPKRIRLEIDRIEQLLGIKIPKKEIIKSLKSLEFKIIQHPRSNNQYLIVEVPTFRLDVSIPEDLVEEVGRIYGYKKIPAVLPKAVLVPSKRNLEIFWEEFTKDVLKEGGFTEFYNYSFISKETGKIFGYKPEELVEIENPLSREYQCLCPSLIPNLLKNVEENFRYFGQIRIFELGKIFKHQQSASLPKARLAKSGSNQQLGKKKLQISEKRALTGIIAHKREKEGMFYELKGVIDTLLEKMGISDVWYDEYRPTPEESKASMWDIDRCAEIRVENKELGFLGEISAPVLETSGIKGKVAAFDIDFEKLQKLASEEHEYRPVSPYPAAARDVAVLVPKNIFVGKVIQVISQAGGDLVRDIDLFDMYEGEEISEDKKNLAFHIVFQAEDRTLTAREIDEVHKKIVKSLENNLEWEVRK